MRLRLLQRNWDQMGATDPLWAVATAPQYRGGKWDESAFFATGVDAVQSIMAWAEYHGLSYPRARALDFGCGVGRLTQALGQHFHEVIGVDLAPSMIQHANTYNSRGAQCRYVLNETPDLRIFPDEHFDFILSEITLMHMEPQYSLAYLREFVRVARPCGLIVFQLPSRGRRQMIRERIPRPVWEAITTVRTWRTPRMEVYGCSHAEVEAALASAGATIVGQEQLAHRANDAPNTRYYASICSGYVTR